MARSRRKFALVIYVSIAKPIIAEIVTLVIGGTKCLRIIYIIFSTSGAMIGMFRVQKLITVWPVLCCGQLNAPPRIRRIQKTVRSANKLSKWRPLRKFAP
jgi:hypothetical protein